MLRRPPFREARGLKRGKGVLVNIRAEGMRKPEPRFYALACDRLGVQPAETIFLGDAELCVTAAREVGLQAILFRHNAQASADIEACLTANRQRP